MSESTTIEWCDSTFNPWIGCTRVSPACDDCYAARSTPARSLGIVWGSKQPRHRTAVSTWKQPLLWEKHHAAFELAHGHRRRVFCASLADVFDNEVPPEWRHDLFELIRLTPHLDWLLLTKRPQNIVRMVHDHGAIASNGMRFLPINTWIGTTAEDQKRANHNVIHLLRAKKKLGITVAFLSVEPMLEAIRLWKLTEGDYEEDQMGAEVYPLKGLYAIPDCDWPGPKLDWVICGGESGPKARPMHPTWARNLRDQCAGADVPFLFKQWGEWIPRGPESMGYPVVDGVPRLRMTDAGHNGSDLAASGGNHCWLQRAGKKVSGRLLDGVEHNGFPGISNAAERQKT